MKKLIILLLLVLVLSGATCSGKETWNENTIWVKIEPIQCLGNDWEQDWLKNNAGQRYRDQDEETVVRNYYEKLGVKVFEFKKEKTSEVTCASCSCPTGWTISLRVYKDDVNKMENLGFQEIE